MDSSQLVTELTRGDNILDVVICNEPLMICHPEAIQPFSNSDHCQVDFKVFIEDCYATSGQATVLSLKRYDWSTANFERIAQHLAAINWYDIITVNLTADSLWDAFSVQVQTAVDQFVCSRNCAAVKQRLRNTWYPPGIRRAIARKRCLWRKHKADPGDNNVAATYRSAASKCKRLIYRFELRKEQKIINSKNTGSFYKFVNSRIYSNKGIGALRSRNGKTVLVSDDERANLLNDFFGTACAADNGTTPVIDRFVPDFATMNTVNFSPARVFAAIRKLKKTNSSGPDGFPPVLFKKLAPVLAEPLSLIFTSFMSVGQRPKAWAHAIVIPVYKGGDASDVSNYRPISLTCVACTIMERIIVSDMLHYLRLHSVIDRRQHGFLSRRSTSTNLLDSLNDWTLAIKNKKSVLVAYIDYAKAFDTVSHAKLFAKLSAYGISGNLLTWITNFLSHRTQQTKVGTALSRVTDLVSGVIQGSVIGPLLFVNDVIAVLTKKDCACQLYADDLKLYTALNTDCDQDELQERLNDLHAWSNTWQLKISYKKCVAMLIDTTGHEPNIELKLGDNVIPLANDVKDLGVHIDSKLSFTVHINHIVTKASARATLISKCFISKDTLTLMHAFNVYVRPLLEYASCVWSPYHTLKIAQIERVQRRFTKKLPGFADIAYKERLRILNTDSLELRHLRNDLIFAYRP
jgi:ribonuclease P/MRP protein subunit RPP40